MSGNVLVSHPWRWCGFRTGLHLMWLWFWSWLTAETWLDHLCKDFITWTTAAVVLYFILFFFCHSSLHWSLTKQHGFLDESSRVSIRAQTANCVNESEEKEPWGILMSSGFGHHCRGDGERGEGHPLYSTCVLLWSLITIPLGSCLFSFNWKHIWKWCLSIKHKIESNKWCMCQCIMHCSSISRNIYIYII